MSHTEALYLREYVLYGRCGGLTFERVEFVQEQGSERLHKEGDSLLCCMRFMYFSVFCWSVHFSDLCTD